MMNIKTKLWSYDKTATDYKGTEYTDYIQLGDQNKDDLTEVLGGAELTLVGLNFRAEFAPTTKFIWEQYNIIDGQETLIDTKYLIVDSDYVSQPILSDDTYFNHHISFLEASAISQERIVDDIAITYKLKDVNLFGSNAVNTTTLAPTKLSENSKARNDNFHFSTTLGMFDSSLYFGRKFKWEWATWLQNSSYPDYSIYNSGIWDNKYQNVDTKDGNLITLSIPMLAVYSGIENSSLYDTTRQGFCAVDVLLTETDIATGDENILENYVVNPCTDNATENEWNASWFDNLMTNRRIEKGDVINYVNVPNGTLQYQLRHKNLARHTNTYDNRYISFIPVKNKKYSLKVSLHNYTDDIDYPVVIPETYISADNGNLPTTDLYARWFNLFGIVVSNSADRYYVNNNVPVATLEFYTYDSSDLSYTLFTSAPPANAYDLFVKAVLCSQDTYKKESGVSITDQETVFYLDPAFVDELKTTQIYENMYHQNNLWQLLVEIGKYIHAIPLIKFGDDDRFEVTFTRLGITDVTENNNPTKQSIFNHRTMEDYISSTSSYVNNLVQGGGIIQEVIAPKSTSSDYIVSNDVAKLITSKNIIELVQLEARTFDNGDVTDWRDITDSVYEKSIYEILPIEANEPNNKGNSIYYSLGTNTIEGFDYILPSVNVGTYDYAIKNILANAFNDIYDNATKRKNLKVNNFVFRITYRTKDSARVDQTRPDLRKYLLASTSDCSPLQYQFNNQQDRVLDAQRFGNNIYGKLIKTGNTTFEINEWLDNLDDLKRVGQLYRLAEDDNNLYYVATVENVNYGTYMISNVTFSKDYNELSNMVGIPSEPRFYEIATENLITREVSNNSHLILGSGDIYNTPYVQPDKRKTLVYSMEYIKDLLFVDGTEYPKYVITCFKNDIDRIYGTIGGNNKFYRGILSPVSTYSVQNTLNIEYDMADNLSAGDNVGDVEYDIGQVDGAYKTLNAVQYTDVYGRADMFDMVILKDIVLDNEQIRELPNSPYSVSHYNSYYELVPSFRQYTYECDRTQVNDWQTDFMTWAEATLPQVVGSITGDAFYVKTKMKFENTNVVPTQTYYKYGLVNLDIHYENGDRVIVIVQDFLQDGEPYPITEYDFNDLSKPLIPTADVVLSSINPQTDIDLQIGNLNRGKILLKDNREIISINTNIHMVTDSDRFVVSGDLWAVKNKPVKLALLRKEVSKIINNKISALDVISLVDITPTLKYTGIELDIVDAVGVGADLSDVKALAIVVDDRVIENNEVIYTPSQYTFVMARNIDGLDENGKVESWYIVPKEIWDN